MSKTSERSGMVLLHTLIFTAVLCMMAVMMLKWIFSYYSLAMRNSRSTIAKAHIHGFALKSASVWNFGTPSDSVASPPPEGAAVALTVSGPSAGMYTVTVTSEQ